MSDRLPPWPMEEIFDVVRRAKARAQSDLKRAREVSRMTGDMGKHDSESYHAGRMDGAEQVLRDLIEDLHRRQEEWAALQGRQMDA